MGMEMGDNIELHPTEGGYQKVLAAVFVRETRTLLIVRPDGSTYDWRFSKKDMLRSGPMKSKFPRYRIKLLKG